MYKTLMRNSSKCSRGDDHCCWIAGHPNGICRFLRDDGQDADRRWVCTLMEELQEWDKVHQDPRYLEHVKPIMLTIGCDCGDYPGDGLCHTCGDG